MTRPGIMIYFDILEPIQVLPDADKGRLLVAMLEYGKDGTEPECDGILALAWGFIKPKIDRDKENYELQIQQKKYASFSREIKKHGLPAVSFDEWKDLSDIERERMISADIERYPTTTTTAAATTTRTTTASTTAAAATTTTAEQFDDMVAAAADKKLRVMNGELGKGVVVLSEFQMDTLLEKMGLDMFDYYVDKLADFIQKNDAHIKNHYLTILKWWAEDCKEGSD